MLFCLDVKKICKIDDSRPKSAQMVDGIRIQV